MSDAAEFEEAVAFLRLVRCYLHYRHERDDNTLDWRAQDAAAAAAIGLGPVGRDGAARRRRERTGRVRAGPWMRPTGCGSTFGMRGWWTGERHNFWRSWERGRMRRRSAEPAGAAGGEGEEEERGSAGGGVSGWSRVW